MDHDVKPVLSNKALIGIPECLLPATDEKVYSPYEIVREGIRDLKKRPLDYRNPHAVKPYEKLNSLQDSYTSDITKPKWPIDDSHAVFDYYSNGNAVIGLPGGPECALIDIHGTLRCFTGAWAFTLGADGAVPDIRNRHLLKGHIPVVLGETRLNGIEYGFEYFAAEIADSPLCDYPISGKQWTGRMQPNGRNIFLCMNCSAKALDDEHQKPIIHIGYAQNAGLCAGAFYARPTYAPAWENVRYEQIDDGRFRLLATSSGRDFTLGLLILHQANLKSESTGFHHWPNPLSASSERTAVSYIVAGSAEAADSEFSCTWIIPYFPLKTKDDAFMLQAASAQLREDCVSLWEKRRSSGMQIRIPEEKVQDTFIQTLNHLDMCCIALDQTEYPTAGASGNHHIGCRCQSGGSHCRCSGL